MNSKKLIQWTLVFFIVLLTTQYFSKKQTQTDPALASTPVILSPIKTEFVEGEEVKVNVKNNTQQVLTVDSKCPLPPLKVLAFNGTDFVEKSSETKQNCTSMSPLSINPGDTKPVTFKYWNHALFSSVGRYKVLMTVPTTAAPASATTSANTATAPTEQTFYSQDFTVVESGTLRTFFRTAFYRPLLNAMVWIVSVIPFHDLGFATIILTILIRLVLLVPSQRALVSQRKMQQLQPKLDKLKKDFAGNQERIAQETMKLWKENGVNPFGSCLPLLIQFPFLIAVYYVVQSGLNPDNAYQLYGALQNFDFNSMNTMFLGILDLTKVNIFVLPLIVGGLQFIQLKLSFANKAKKDAATKQHTGHPLQKKEESTPAVTDEIAAANKSMVYVMPVMIALFAATTPAGVGLYWAISTLFGIGQQLVVNKKA